MFFMLFMMVVAAYSSNDFAVFDSILLDEKDVGILGTFWQNRYVCGLQSAYSFMKYVESSLTIQYIPLADNIWYKPRFNADSLPPISVCPFHNDLAGVIGRLGVPKTVDIGSLTLEGEGDWQCWIPDRYLCDTTSNCLTDECHCPDDEVERFFCAQGTGCIVFPQVCDGVADCRDASDECLCQGFIKVTCPPELDNATSFSMCYSQEHFCYKISDNGNFKSCNTSNLINCTEFLQFLGKKETKFTPLHQCLEDKYSSSEHQLVLPLFCANNCNTYFDDRWKKFCPHLAPLYPQRFGFRCSNPNDDVSPYKPLYIDILCNKVIDCPNGVDEMGCPDGRFYCDLEENSTNWVKDSQRCNNIKDCPNGRDECVDCRLGALTSEKYLLRSFVIMFMGGILGIVICLLNGWQIYKTFWNTQESSVGKNDRILRLQIHFFDFLMGIYLCMILIATVIIAHKGDYCQFDQDWRSSIFCTIFGVTFSFSSQGSLMVISLMSIIRSIQCRVSFIRISKELVILLSAGIWSINLITVLVPVLPTAYIQNIFRSELHLNDIKNNPFLDTFSITQLQTMHTTLSPDAGPTDIYSIFKVLGNITSDPNLFDYTEIGYYGSSPLCIHNIFKSHPSYKTYKICYSAAAITLLLVVCVCYIVILKEVAASKKVIMRQDDPRRKQYNPSITIKISLIITSQLLSWIPFISVAVYFMVFPEKGIPDMLYETFAVVVIPANSLLNPIFYSEIYKVVAENVSYDCCFGWIDWPWKERVVEEEIEMDVITPNMGAAIAPNIEQ